MKYAILIGRLKDGPLEVIGLDVNPIVLEKIVDEITINNGNYGSGKGKKVYSDLELIHNRRGRIKHRNNLA